MKKIFYFLLMMISGIVWGQISQFNNLCTNNSNLQLSNTFYDFKFKTPASCSQDQNDSYKSINYYKVVTDGSFEFVLRSSKLVNYHVWVLSETELNNFFLNKESRYDALRSSYTATNNEKGLFNIAIDNCEFYGSADGKLKPIDVVSGQYIIIGVLGADINTNFSISPGGTATVCEPEPNGGDLNYSALCIDESYKLLDIKIDIKNNISSKFGDNTINENNIKVFPENSTTPLSNDITSVVNGTTQINQTYISKIYDDLGKLKYIYTLTFYFRPPIDFNEFFVNGNSQLRNITTCQTIFEWKGKNWYLNTYLNITNPSDYDILYIKYVDKNGVTQTINDPENIYNIEIPTNGILMLDIRVKSMNPLKCDNEADIVQSIKNETIILNPKYEMSFCEGSIFDYNSILDKIFPSGHSGYTLETSIADGATISFGSNTQLTYLIKVKYGGSCITNDAQLILKKTSPAKIKNAIISGACLTEFKEDDVNDAVKLIQDNPLVSYYLRFYKQDGTEILESELFNYIKTNKTGKIIVKALAVDNGNTICDTDVELNFALDESTFQTVSNIPTLNSACSEVGLGHTFTISEIETYLKSKFGRIDITFNGISDEFLTDNQSKTITFQVRINGEPCWSEEMTLKLQVITKPNVNNALHELKADCDDKITIDAQVLINLFGANSIVDYHYEILHNNSMPLTFDASGKASVKVLFKNKLDNSCFIEKEIIINKKQDLVVDIVTLETYTKDHPVIFCEGDDANAKNQIEDILDYIKSKYPTLVAKSTVDEIYTMFNSNNGFVEIVFEDPNYCGTEKIKFYYQKNALPNFAIPTSAEICSATKYILDFEQLAKDRGLDVNDYIFDVDGIDKNQVSTYQYELGVGDYTITIKNIDSGCPKVLKLKLTNSETPTITKITINEKSVIVSAKGNGKLEYALFDSDGKVIVDWQTKNELIIPDKIKNNDFTVRVRLNNCGVSEEVGIIYLDLPNVVTPNNDGFNDIWKPRTNEGQTNDLAKSYKLLIFDRYGKQILSKEGIGIIEWDGTLNGHPLADGTYWYLLQGSKSGMLEVQYSGSILVKRKIN